MDPAAENRRGSFASSGLPQSVAGEGLASAGATTMSAAGSERRLGYVLSGAALSELLQQHPRIGHTILL